MSMLGLDLEEKLELLEMLELKSLKQKQRYIDSLFPDTGVYRRELYPKHLQFFQRGKEFAQRLFCAANRVGKTYGAGVEVTYHLTGQYPWWWDGKVFSIPQYWCIAGESWKDVKGVLQDKLLGTIGEFGQGLIPFDVLDFKTMTSPENINTLIQSFKVKHISGGYSTVIFKSYESGRKAFQGFEGNIWLDEEPPLEVYSECVTRTATQNEAGEDHILMMTFTPLLGMSDTIMNFMPDGLTFDGSPGLGKWITNVEMKDVPHISEKKRKELEASYHPHVREARLRGIPALDGGAIYPVPESDFTVKRFTIPPEWKRGFGMDVGNTRTAVIWFAQDPDSLVWYGYDTHYQGEVHASVHAQAILARGQWIPGVVDSAANASSQTDGENLMDMYKKLGLDIQNADKSVQTGLYLCWQMLSDGSLKIFDHLNDFLKEIRGYSRDEKGKVIKKNDHLMDAMRYFIMSGRDRAAFNKPRQSAIPAIRPQFRINR